MDQLYISLLSMRGGAGGKTVEGHLHIDKTRVFKTEHQKPAEATVEFDAGAVQCDVEADAKDLRIVIKEHQNMMSGLVKGGFIGEAVIPLADLEDGTPRDEWYMLKAKGGKDPKQPLGDVRVRTMRFSRSTADKPGRDHFEFPLQRLCRAGEVDVFKKLLERTEDRYIEAKDKDKSLPLHVCCECEQPELVTLLLKAGARVDAQDREGRTPLHVAASKCAKAVDILADAGADVEAVDQSEAEEEQRPLHHAAWANNGKAVKKLIARKAKLNAQTEQGSTPLHFALQQHAHDALVELVKAGANIFKKNAKGDTPAVLAIKLAAATKGAATKNAFFRALDIEDDRELDLLKGALKKRTRVDGDYMGADWKDSQQFALSVSEPTDVSLLVHYVGHRDTVTPRTKLTPRTVSAAASFILVELDDASHIVKTFQTNTVHYGGPKPLTLPLSPDKKYAVIPFANRKEFTGAFSLLVFCKPDQDVDIIERVPWPYELRLTGSWKGDSAVGTVGLDGWEANPQYKIELPTTEDPLTLVTILGQKPSPSDVVPHQVSPYELYIGFHYMYEELDDVHEQLPTMRNAREVEATFQFKADDPRCYVLVPYTAKAGQETDFTLWLCSEEPIKATIVRDGQGTENKEVESEKVEMPVRGGLASASTTPRQLAASGDKKDSKKKKSKKGKKSKDKEGGDEKDSGEKAAGSKKKKGKKEAK